MTRRRGVRWRWLGAAAAVAAMATCAGAAWPASAGMRTVDLTLGPAQAAAPAAAGCCTPGAGCLRTVDLERDAGTPPHCAQVEGPALQVIRLASHKPKALHANAVVRVPWKDPATDASARECVTKAAQAFGIGELPIYLIMDVERGAVGMESRNANGTYDLGPMQVNTWWLKRMAREGITRDELTNNLCTNIFAGAWIYAQEYQRTGSVAEAIAAYHSPTPRHQARYLGMVIRAIDRRLARADQELEQKEQ